jgi:C-terminal processing protease CtpA/Prc
VLDTLRSINFAFRPVSLDYTTVPGRTIATLPIDGFVASAPKLGSVYEEIRATIGQILSNISDADALLVDLRQNGGGDPHTVSFIMSYLLDDGPVHILDFVDRSGNIEESFSTLPSSELPEGTTRFGGTKPLFVLTTKNTISGGEEMAYDLKAFKRSRAVIGEGNTTAGATNPITKLRFICEEIFGKGWWVVAVPSVRAVHAVTGTNWEGVGVLSDVVAGDGEWEGLSDAEEVGKSLLKRILEGNREGRVVMIFGFIGIMRPKSNRFGIYKICLCFFFSSLLSFPHISQVLWVACFLLFLLILFRITVPLCRRCRARDH